MCQVRLIHLALMGSVYLLLTILLPTLLFWLLEPGWSFLDGVYFVFISLTTIGLGDYIPGDHPLMAEYQVIGYLQFTHSPSIELSLRISDICSFIYLLREVKAKRFD